jgi:hypothetical protein
MDMQDRQNRERICWIYLLVSNALSSAFALAEPPQAWWRLLLHLVLPIILVMISTWQLFAMHKRRNSNPGS